MREREREREREILKINIESEHNKMVKNSVVCI